MLIQRKHLIQQADNSVPEAEFHASPRERKSLRQQDIELRGRRKLPHSIQ